jgi:hypothetical protein
MRPAFNLGQIIAEMQRIDIHAEHQSPDAEDLAELAFFRLLRNAFAEFLETKPWVRTVGSDYWRGVDTDDGRSGVRFDISVDHPQGDMELEVIIQRGCN